ncbi:MAG: hypothetical protein ACI87H_003810, partial [Gammaproteobacteria bacterium]
GAWIATVWIATAGLLLPDCYWLLPAFGTKLGSN